MSEENELPVGWVWTTLEEVTAPIRISVQPIEYPTLPYVGMEHVEAETMRLIGTGSASELKSSTVRFWPGDVLYGRLRPYLNKVLRPDFEGLCSPEFLIFRKPVNLDSRYLQYFLNSWSFKEFASHLNEGDRPRVDWSQLKVFPFPLAPLAEQHRIVSAIEQQFTRLDAGVAALRRAQAKLKLYRASVLKAAVEGKMTEDWRTEHPTTEPASILLEGILKERRAKWETDLRSKGKDPAKVKYVEPAKPDMEGLPELPEGWCWSTLETVADAIDPQPSHRTPPTVEDGVPYVGIGDVKDGKICLNQARRVSTNVFDEHQLRYQLKIGDFIFGKIGTIGRPVELTEPFNYTLSANVVLIQPHDKFFNSNFVFFYMASPFIEKLLVEGSRATTQAAFGILKVRLLPFPLPPLIEQNEIVLEVERRLSVVSHLEAIVEANLKRAERLRQSILKEAFAGRLVPQDPNDEPASVLLECIRMERAGRKKGMVGNGRYVDASGEAVQIDVAGTRQVELWESVGG